VKSHEYQCWGSIASMDTSLHRLTKPGADRFT